MTIVHGDRTESFSTCALTETCTATPTNAASAAQETDLGRLPMSSQSASGEGSIKAQEKGRLQAPGSTHMPHTGAGSNAQEGVLL
jgi:hypothetical protein